MFKKKDNLLKSSITNEIPARFIKKGGIIKDYTSYENYPQPTFSSGKGRYLNEESISASEISESYMPSKNQRQTVPNSSKGARKKFPPFFLLRKKKSQSTNQICQISEEDCDNTDIACYADLLAEHQSLNPVILGQLDDSQLTRIEVESYEKVYKCRVEHLLNNYRKPPPYPGSEKNREEQTRILHDVDTPLLRQLLNDKNLNDNASMNNFWQVSPTHHAEQKKLLVDNMREYNDKLVDRTKDRVTKTKSADLSSLANTGELYEKRRQYYVEVVSNFHENYSGNMHSLEFPQRDSVSEILFPERDYDTSEVSCVGLSASVPDLSLQQRNKMERNRLGYRQRRGYMEPVEIEALIAHYRKTSLDTFEPYGVNRTSSESVSLYSEGSPSYVPPSPYLNAEIPEWLQVYAKASPDLDKYLKWEMFRYPELDCWQTMLKRLYKKELEQVVLWFEEYRVALQQELEDRHLQMNFSIHSEREKFTNIEL